MRPTTLILGFLCVVNFCVAQTKPPVVNEVQCDRDPLATLKFDKIVAYTINYDPVKKQRTHTQMEKAVTKYNLQPDMFGSCFQTVVPASSHKKIVQLFTDTGTYGAQYADCFEPRFVLQFMSVKQEVFRLVICEGCGFLESTKPIPAAYSRWFDYASEEDGKPITYRRYKKGFSPKGTKAINELCKQLGMAYCGDVIKE